MSASTKNLNTTMTIPETFDEADLEDLLEAFRLTGATITPGTGKLFVAGTEINIEDVFREVFQDPKEE